MSIIERYSPLNLAYKVVIVTNASSPLGVIISNTLLKANALVLGTDTNAKVHSLSAATYSHFQFYQCKLAEGSAAEEIIADAKRKFKVERIDALVNLASADDDEATQAAHRKLAVECAKTMKDAIDGGSIVNTYLEAANVDEKAAQTVERLVRATKEVNEETASKKVRCNMIAGGDKENLQPFQKHADAKDHFNFLYKPSSNNPSKAGKTASEETKIMYELSNVVLFLASGMSEGIDGVVLNHEGHLLQK